MAYHDIQPSFYIVTQAGLAAMKFPIDVLMASLGPDFWEAGTKCSVGVEA